MKFLITVEHNSKRYKVKNPIEAVNFTIASIEARKLFAKAKGVKFDEVFAVAYEVVDSGEDMFNTLFGGFKK